MTDRIGPRDGFTSPRFGQPPTFMRLPHVRDLSRLDIAIVGVPYDGATSYRPGARFGPRHIRDQSSLIRPWNPILEVAPFEVLRVADYGDVDVSPVSIDETFAAVERELAPVVDAGVTPIAIGGDHSITLPVLRALARRHGPLSLVHFDSHPDTWGEYAGSYHYHGSTFRRAIEEGIVDGARLIQIGIRGPIYARDDFEFHAEHGLEVIRIGDVKEQGVARALERVARLRGRPLYLSFDIDAVDPAYAPATGTPEVGGLTSYEALCLVRGLRDLDLIGADIVEVAPPYDGPGAITSLLAANLLFEIVSLFALRQR